MTTERVKYDYLLFTDGSGYEDGYSGYCATVIFFEGHIPQRRTVVGCMTGSSVDRAEMTALIAGLQLAREIDNSRPKVRLGQEKPKIQWFNDREAFVKSVRGEYTRRSSPDLWAVIQYFETLFTIEAQFVGRETVLPDFKVCDLHASSLRVVIRDYAENSLFSGVLGPSRKLKQPKKKAKPSKPDEASNSSPAEHTV